ncbi:excisionase family DNA-binding protein [Bacillus sp. FSL M8-0049]|uniref:excisionase family DNA-binding protein n=1 Tax=Bacillus sp. FSL M8-0049 TaxID=2954573 RepID=UPI003158C903
MYLTIAETAEYLEVSEAYIKKLIQQKKIRCVFDGESYLIYQGQFQTHLKQLEQYKELVQEILNEPIPEDPDVKDED